MSVQFDHLRAGTPESDWIADGRLGTRARLRLTARATYGRPGPQLVVVAAHPDDESLGAGGLIASAAAQGWRVRVIVATDGDASHPLSPTHSARRLAQIRRDEVGAAVAQLDPTARVTLLALPDGRLTQCRRELTDAISVQLGEVADAPPGTGGAADARARNRVLLVTPWTADRHPDHEVCARAGGDAIGRLAQGPRIEHWQYPIWLWHWAVPAAVEVPWPAMGVLELDPGARRAKRRAVACHASQHEPLSDHPGDEAILPPRLLAHFTRPFETFVVASVPADTA